MGKFAALRRTIGFQVTTATGLCMAILLLLLVAETLYAIDKANDSADWATQEAMTLNIGDFDAQLEAISNQLMLTGTTVPQLSTLPILGNNARFFAEQDIFNRLYSLLGLYDDVVAFFVFEPQSEYLFEIHSFERYIAGKRQAALQTFLLSNPYGDDIAFLGTWTPVQADGEWYLLCLYRYNRVYLSACISVEILAEGLREQRFYEDGLIFLADSAGTPLHATEEAEALGINLSRTGSWSFSGPNGSYRALAKSFGNSNIHIVYARPVAGFWHSLDTFQRVWLIAAVLSVLILIPWTLSVLRRVVLLPLRELSVAIARIGSRSLDYRITSGGGSAELQEIFSAFNQMSTQIERLQEELREKGREEQRLMIANLQHQMRPHFIVNTLNLIYNNTYTGNDELIRKVIEHLTSYLRYTLHSDRAIVPLHREISYIRDYLEIQRCYYQDMLFYSLDVDPACEEIPTPCLLLTPLVENCIKHGFHRQGPTQVDVSCTLSPGGNRLWISVRDNGEGFSEEALKKIEQEESVSQRESLHIGLWNVRRRLELIYGEQATFRAGNLPEGGAEVTLSFPCRPDSSINGTKLARGLDREGIQRP